MDGTQGTRRLLALGHPLCTALGSIVTDFSTSGAPGTSLHENKSAECRGSSLQPPSHPVILRQ